MVGLHVALGLAVVALNGTAGVLGLVAPPEREETFWTVAGLALGALGLQVITGFFVLGSTVAPPDVLHVLLPVLGLFLLLLVRSLPSRRKTKIVGAASLAVAAAALYPFVGVVTQRL
jgi:hypothetical protein